MNEERTGKCLRLVIIVSPSTNFNTTDPYTPVSILNN